jgi:hypothetical protein
MCGQESLCFIVAYTDNLEYLGTDGFSGLFAERLLAPTTGRMLGAALPFFYSGSSPKSFVPNPLIAQMLHLIERECRTDIPQRIGVLGGVSIAGSLDRMSQSPG